MNTRSFIGYDWFKLSIACILGALLWAIVSVGSLPEPEPPAAPAAPLPAAPQLSIPAAVGQVSAEAITFSGTADPNANILVRIDNIPAGLVRSGDDGQWALATRLDQPGEHTIVVQVLDDLGAPIVSSAPTQLTVATPET